MALGLKKKAQYFMSKKSGTGAVSFATDSWDIVQAEAKRISKYYEDNGVLPIDTPYAIYDQEGGDTDNVRTITLSDNTQIEVCIIGMCHDTLTTAYDNGGTKAGLTLGMVNSLGTDYKMNANADNAGGWNACEFRTTLNSTIFATLPQAVQDVIPYVNKLASEGNKSSTILTSSDKMFLLAFEEVMGTIYSKGTTTQNSFSGEGTQYAFFANAPLIVDTNNVTYIALSGTSGTCKSNGTAYINRFGESMSPASNVWANYRATKGNSYQPTNASHYRTRSPYYNGGAQFLMITANGGGATLPSTAGANNAYPVSFAFCI